MQLPKFLRALRRRNVNTKIKRCPVAPKIVATDAAAELSLSSYAQRLRSHFDRCSELCEAMTRPPETDVLSRIHPMLAVKVNASLRRTLYANFFTQAKLTIAEVGNFPKTIPGVVPGTAFGTDFVSFEQWAVSGGGAHKELLQYIGDWQPFIDLVCSISDVLSNPAAGLANGKLPPDMRLLAEAASKEGGWDRMECMSPMCVSASVTVTQLRRIIETIIPKVFADPPTVYR
jgi:hypothetical protein